MFCFEDWRLLLKLGRPLWSPTRDKYIAIFDQEKENFNYIFLFNLGHQNPGSGLDPDPYSDSLEMLDPDSMKPDPQLCF